MVSSVVIYTSQTGFTQGYALVIAKQLHCEVLDSKFITPVDLMRRDLVIYGGHAWMGGVSGFADFYRRYEPFLPEQLLVFATGMLEDAQVDQNKLRAKAFRQCQRQPQLFYFPGRIDPKTLPMRLRLKFHLNQRKGPASQCQNQQETVRPLIEAVQHLDGGISF